MKSFFAALSFLTIIPIPSRWQGNETSLSRSTLFFPLVGLLIGIAIAALDCGLGRLFPTVLTSALSLTAMIFASRGLHLDGLADTADGLLSSRSKEKMLEIMRDSRTGPMGVAAVVCALLIKYGILISIPFEVRWQTVLLMPLAGRVGLVTVMALFPYTRSNGGLASPFAHLPLRISAILGLVLFCAAGSVMMTWTGLASAGFTLGGILLVALFVFRKIGGYTGDTLGAGCEIAEAWVGLGIIALHPLIVL